MQIYDSNGNKQLLRQIDVIKTQMVIDGIEHTGFHIRGTNEGIFEPTAELSEKKEIEIMERLTEEYDYLGAPIV
ncbi:MAG TPA: hypothetical protein DCS09_09800 [Porphyromonadaceae bacterium]|nr:hypothetical protein [Porphyromonadaceae bacterium]